MILTCESSSFTFESSSVVAVNFCFATVSNSWVISSCVERIAPDRLLLVELKTEVGVGPNLYPWTCPCLSRPMTWVYAPSTNVDATNNVEVEEDIPLGWDCNCWNWSLNYKKQK